ncbi:Hypothetical_protein [Hexamita inflata]|uniref:Hypothetical_protein n=1 Tax=Hexamita inflata TaxID=28002 RepID=A0AA86N6C0_9EUKA|nr:Hypothetical protein HINF_LOCUS1226 [Hexamita inflata]
MVQGGRTIRLRATAHPVCHKNTYRNICLMANRRVQRVKKRENNLAQGIIFSNSKLLTFLKNLRERKNGIEVSVQVKQSYKYFINCLNDSQIVRLLTTTDNTSGENQDYQVQNSKLLIC